LSTSIPNTYFSARTAIAVVIANMIGTGVFTSLGYQLESIQSGFVILMLWAVGGVTALCGALSYAEIGSALPRSGGEYNFLSRMYHPAAGFISGWISSTIGFSAPVALAAMTFGAYATSSFSGVPDWFEKFLACTLIVIMMIVHAGRRNASGSTQFIFTALKILVMLAFCLFALLAAPKLQPVYLTPIEGDTSLLFSGAFAISLIYVSYAYTGWNAATYLSGELRNPQKELPRILFFGTLIVMTLYVLLNAVFLLVAPIEELTGQLDVGVIAARSVFGGIGAKFTGLALAALLISTVSAMTIAGPRVLQMIGEDFPLFRSLGMANNDNIPARAIIMQSSIALLFVLTSTFDRVLIFAGFVLAFNSFITVVGLFILRIREPQLIRPFRVPLYPLTPILYLLLNGWTLIFVFISRPIEALAGIVLIFLGGLLYMISKRFQSVTDLHH